MLNRISIFRIATLCVLLCAMSCKSSKTFVSNGEVNDNISARQLIRAVEKSNTDFKTFQSRLNLEYSEGEKSQSFNLTLRIEKDETIWLSATLGLARAIITPEKVQFYDKINNQYFAGDYSILSDFLGTELDFFQLQSLLLGESIVDLNKGTYNLANSVNSYGLQPKQQKTLYNLLVLFNPSHFKMDGFSISQPRENRQLMTNYKSFQKVNNKLFPEQIDIIATEDNESVFIKLEMKSISLNEALRFPFRIPSGYKEIVLK